MSFDKKPRTSINIGDVIQSVDKASGNLKTIDKDGEKLDSFQLQVYIPDDIDEAGCGEPSIVLKKGNYLNLRVHSQAEVSAMPEWKQKIVQLKVWLSTNRTSTPKK